jgi:hypothetical protein
VLFSEERDPLLLAVVHCFIFIFTDTLYIFELNLLVRQSAHMISILNVWSSGAVGATAEVCTPKP